MADRKITAKIPLAPSELPPVMKQESAEITEIVNSVASVLDCSNEPREFYLATQ